MREMHEKHERLCAAECLELQSRLVMNEIRSFQADNPNNEIGFRGVAVKRLFSRDELDDLRSGELLRVAVRPGFLIFFFIYVFF